MNMKNEKCYSILMGNVKLKCSLLERFDLHHKIGHGTNLVYFLKTITYLCVIIDSLSSWTFHFLAGVICMIEARIAKKKLVTVFRFSTSHFSH